MIHWPESLGYWIGAALLLFWLVGAYNRLMRLRTAALQAYATLDAALVRQLDFVQSRTQPEPSDAVASTDASAQASVHASTAQLSTLLAATRLHPLDPASIAALATALHVMLAAWERLHPFAVLSFGADGTLSRPVPIGLKSDEPPATDTEIPIAWPEPSPAAELARRQFNTAVAAYNTAIAQCPALLVAWVMQLRRAAPLPSLV